MTDAPATLTCTVVIDDGKSVAFPAGFGAPVLDALARVTGQPVAVGCRGGGCGACRVQILEGHYDTKKMSKRHVTAEEAADGYALACRVFPLEPLLLRPAPRLP